MLNHCPLHLDVWHFSSVPVKYGSRTEHVTNKLSHAHHNIHIDFPLIPNSGISCHFARNKSVNVYIGVHRWFQSVAPPRGSSCKHVVYEIWSPGQGGQGKDPITADSLADQASLLSPWSSFIPLAIFLPFAPKRPQRCQRELFCHHPDHNALFMNQNVPQS